MDTAHLTSAIGHLADTFDNYTVSDLSESLTAAEFMAIAGVLRAAGYAERARTMESEFIHGDAEARATLQHRPERGTYLVAYYAGDPYEVAEPYALLNVPGDSEAEVAHTLGLVPTGEPHPHDAGRYYYGSARFH